MQILDVQPAPRTTTRAGVVIATDLTRRYGDGTTAVDALAALQYE
jgi:hypothetical protein